MRKRKDRRRKCIWRRKGRRRKTHRRNVLKKQDCQRRVLDKTKVTSTLTAPTTMLATTGHNLAMKKHFIKTICNQSKDAHGGVAIWKDIGETDKVTFGNWISNIKFDKTVKDMKYNVDKFLGKGSRMAYCALSKGVKYAKHRQALGDAYWYWEDVQQWDVEKCAKFDPYEFKVDPSSGVNISKKKEEGKEKEVTRT